MGAPSSSGERAGTDGRIHPTVVITVCKQQAGRLWGKDHRTDLRYPYPSRGGDRNFWESREDFDAFQPRIGEAVAGNWR
jgi:hypothetical protein